jgi:hypothetical protein
VVHNGLDANLLFLYSLWHPDCGQRVLISSFAFGVTFPGPVRDSTTVDRRAAHEMRSRTQEKVKGTYSH